MAFMFSLESIKNSVIDLHGAGASEYFKTYLTLKTFGLTKDNPVYVDTANTNPVLTKLYHVRKLVDIEGFEEQPFYDPLTNTSLKKHAARSIIQTHCKRFHDGSIPIQIEWIKANQMPDKKWMISFVPSYPKGLGSGKNGLASREEEQITIPMPAFITWFFRYEKFDEKPTFHELLSRLKKEMYLDELEIALLFTNERTFSEDPFTKELLNEDELAKFIAHETSKGAKAITSKTRQIFSEKRVNKIIGTFRLTSQGTEGSWEINDLEKEAIDILENQKSIILYGPPGTGKTRLAFILANKIVNGDESRIHKFQFHSSFSYEDFVEALLPQPIETGGIIFKPEKKRFLIACEEAQKIPQVVILDEFNRADVPKVFGEAILLLETQYRKKEYTVCRLYNPSELFWIPENLYIIATMNNIDKSTYDIDFAILRRFGQLKVNPSPTSLANMLRNDGCVNEDLIRIVCSLLSEVQQFYPLGHGYFKGLKNKEDLKKIYRRSIRPVISAYLGEYRQSDIIEIDKLFQKALDSKTWEEFVGEEDIS